MAELNKLQIQLNRAYPDEVFRKNIEYSISLNLPMLQKGTETGKISICGGGTSLKDSVKEIEGDIIAVNGTYDWLLNQGIVPKYAMFWDAGGKVVDYLSNPQKETTFLISSTCAPEVFEKLQGCKILLWHPYAEPIINEVLEEQGRHGEYMICGGCSAMTRAPAVAHFMGYTEIHLHGADSSLDSTGASHVGDGTANRNVMHIHCAGKDFNAPTWLAVQAEEFLLMTEMMPEAKIIVHGEGLLPHIARVNGMHYNN